MSEVTERRTSAEFAHQMRALVDVHYPDAGRIAVVLDNLSTHSPAALHQACPPAEARRLLKRLGFHFTPKHGSWLNMAELEFSALNRQCLDRRIADRGTLQREITAWQEARNAARATRHEPPCSGASRSLPPGPNRIGPIQHDPCGRGLVRVEFWLAEAIWG